MCINLVRFHSKNDKLIKWDQNNPNVIFHWLTILNCYFFSNASNNSDILYFDEYLRRVFFLKIKKLN